VTRFFVAVVACLLLTPRPTWASFTAVFLDAAAGSAELSRRDPFIRSLSPFDRSARLKTAREVSEEEFIAFIGAEALDWSAEERARLSARLQAVRPRLSRYRLDLPPSIKLVKTTGREEGNTPYTRGETIFIPRDFVASQPDDRLEHILIHEAFHLLSRRNRELRFALYALIGFRPCSPVLPPELEAVRITNPDAPEAEACVELDGGGRRAARLPVLLSRTERYDELRQGEFFDYLQFRLLELEPDGRAARDEAGSPRLSSVAALPSYLQAIGGNTDYIIHPEEVMAENFVLLVQGRTDVPSPAILRGMAALLEP
jgi:hypothetical protein